MSICASNEIVNSIKLNFVNFLTFYSFYLQTVGGVIGAKKPVFDIWGDVVSIVDSIKNLSISFNFNETFIKTFFLHFFYPF